MSENQQYLDGRRLYGNDFAIEEISQWYLDEQNGYADLRGYVHSTYVYGFHALNQFHGFSKYPTPKNARVLAYGAAYGDELVPLKAHLKEVIVLDPSKKFIIDDSPIENISWQTPEISGKLAFKDNNFDIITCFGVLHHVPNVEFVISEMFRVLKPGGVIFIREPIVSMGDWTKQRRGLTKRERGIPFHLFERYLLKAGLTISHCSLCVFPPLVKIIQKLKLSDYPFDSPLFVALDSMISRVFHPNKIKYHRTSWIHKCAPTNAMFVCTKHDQTL